MSEYEYWKDLGNIFDAVANYQKKNAEFNDRFINPWIRLGNIFEHQDHNEQAIQAYHQAAETDPDAVQNWINLGNAQFKSGDYLEAVSSFNKATSLDPKAGLPLSNLALTLVTQGKYEEAIPLYIASIELLSDDKEKAMVWNRIGNAYRKLNKYEDAFISFQKADELDSENTGFRDSLDENPISASIIAPEEILDEKSAQQPVEIKEEPAEHETQTKQVNVEAPAIQNQTGLKENPTENASPRIPSWLKINGSAQFKKEAIHTDQKASIGEVTGIESGQLLQEATTSEATMSVETDTEPIPEQMSANPVVNEDNATATASEPKVKNEANMWVEKVFAQEDSVLVTESATPEEDFGELAYEEYLKDVVEPSTIFPDPMEDIHAGIPQTKVSANGEVHIAMDSKNAHVWNELGNVYFNSNAYDDAIAAYSKAIELDRHFAWPYSNLALAYVQKGRLAEAILLYQRGIELFTSDKDKAVTWNRLGNVYRRMNDYDNAIVSYQTADELDPVNTTLSLRSSFGLLGNMVAEQKPAVIA